MEFRPQTPPPDGAAPPLVTRTPLAWDAVNRTRDANADSDARLGPDAGRPTYAAVVLADEPVLYLRMGEPDGQRLVVDASSSKNSGQFNFSSGPVKCGIPGAIAGDRDTACHFERSGGSGYATFSATALGFAARQSFSLEVWARPTDVSNYATILAHQEGQDGYALQTNRGDSRPIFVRANASGSTVLIGSTGSIPDAYGYFVATYDGAIMRL